MQIMSLLLHVRGRLDCVGPTQTAQDVCGNSQLNTVHDTSLSIYLSIKRFICSSQQNGLITESFCFTFVLFLLLCLILHSSNDQIPPQRMISGRNISYVSGAILWRISEHAFRRKGTVYAFVYTSMYPLHVTRHQTKIVLPIKCQKVIIKMVRNGN